MENQAIEEILNETFAGLTLYCRDAAIEAHLWSKYEVNQIIMERGFTDVTYKIGGFTKNCRYLIASSKGKDLSIFNPNAKILGHIVLQANSYFKVLSIQHQADKTQILLLNIPKKGVAFFNQATINLEDQIILEAEAQFKQHIEAAPIPALQSPDWIARTAFPIGMDNEGLFF
ncbi:MAG: hypothetical protein R2828_09045 [Saprospiraceae bacterium]